MNHSSSQRSPAATRKLAWAIPDTITIARIATVAVSILLVWLGLFSQPAAAVFGTSAVLLCGYPIFKSAFSALLERRMNMELSMVIALIAALVVGEVFTAQVIIFFVLLAEELEHATLQRGRASISSLLDLLPRVAHVKQGSDFIERDVAQLRIGDVILVRPGARIVVDGVVVAGQTFVDEATITGESMPVEKVAGSNVFAGTINQSGAIEVRADRIGTDTAFGQIVHAVESAENSKANIQRVADRFAGYLVLFSILAAAATFLITHDVKETISVIIVSGACGIVAGTPLALLGSIGRAAQQGSIVKGGLYMERLADVDTVVFDKTGTLTYGKPHVVAVLPAEGQALNAVLETAAAAENLSEHPLARAVLERAAELGIKPKAARSFNYTPGRGISCTVDGAEVVVGNRALMQERGITGLPPRMSVRESVSEVYVGLSGVFVGSIQIADTVRAEAKQAIAELKRMKIRTVMLTGDAEAVASTVAATLGIDEYAAQLSPEDKRQRVHAIQQSGRKAAMIGDGVNDAPALTEAAVGVAVGSATDIALESADVVLIGNDLVRFVDTLRIARRCRIVIYTNFVGTIAVDTIGMLLAWFGMLNPMLAALVHVGSEIVFLLNAARLLMYRRR